MLAPHLMKHALVGLLITLGLITPGCGTNPVTKKGSCNWSPNHKKLP